MQQVDTIKRYTIDGFSNLNKIKILKYAINLNLNIFFFFFVTNVEEEFGFQFQ